MNKAIAESEVFKSVRGSIMVQYQAGKLKDVHIKKFLANYYDGNPNDMLKGSNKQQLLEDYILIHEAMVGDDLVNHDFKEKYLRHNIPHCCGSMLNKLPNNNHYCEVCGTEYE